MWTKQQYNDYQRKNRNRAIRAREARQPEQLDRHQVGEEGRGKTMGTQYRLCRVEIEFYAHHGQQLDEDNRRFIAKPILDALVNLGFARNDKDITSETTQRMDENQTDH